MLCRAFSIQLDKRAIIGFSRIVTDVPVVADLQGSLFVVAKKGA